MKKIFLTIMVTTFICSYSFADTPPIAVLKAFTAQFITATKVSWSKESAKEWEAEFIYEGKKISANYAEDGTWLETEIKINVADLPKAVSAIITSNYSAWIISEADKTETSKNGLIYEVDLKKGLKKKDLAFKEDGTPVVE